MTGRAYGLSSTSEGGDNGVFLGLRCGGGVVSVEVGVGRFSIYGGGFVGMYKDVEVRNRSITCRVFDGVL